MIEAQDPNEKEKYTIEFEEIIREVTGLVEEMMGGSTTKRKFPPGEKTFACISHQFAGVATQVDTGLYVTNRTAAFLKSACTTVANSNVKSLIDAAANVEKANIKEKWKHTDQMSAHFSTTMLWPKVVAQITAAQESMMSRLAEEVVKPLQDTAKELNASLKVVAQEEQKVSTEMNRTDGQLQKDRAACLKALDALKLAEKEKQEQEAEGGSKYARAMKTWETARGEAHSLFKSFDELVSKANKQNRKFYKEDMPNVMEELQELEQKRLELLKGTMEQYIRLQQEFVHSVTVSLQQMEEAVPDLSSQQDIQAYLAQIINKQGQTPGIIPFRADLPCSAADILAGNYDGKDRGNTDDSGSEAAKKKGSVTWTSDEDATECKLCRSKFTLLFRRHHCRACGGVVCGDCSRHKLVVAQFKQPVRVCSSCYSQSAVGQRETRAHTSAPPPAHSPKPADRLSAPAAVATSSDAAAAAAAKAEAEQQETVAQDENKEEEEEEEVYTVQVRALYDYPAHHPGDLQLNFGDVVKLTQTAYEAEGEWYSGVCLRTGEKGDFPKTYAELFAPTEAVALYAHSSDLSDYLNFKEGETIYVTSQDDENWWYGEQANPPVGTAPLAGYFPKDFVQLKEAGADHESRSKK